MTSCFMIIASGKNGLLKGGVRGHIDMTLVGEDPFDTLPVRQTRAKGRENGSIH